MTKDNYSMTHSNFTPPPPTPAPLPPSPTQKPNGLGEILPFLAFVGFGYIALTIGNPDRMIWEAPAKANQSTPIPPMCISDGEWSPCKGGDPK